MPLVLVGYLQGGENKVSEQEAASFASEMSRWATLKVPYLKLSSESTDFSELRRIMESVDEVLSVLSQLSGDERKAMIQAEELYRTIKQRDDKPDIMDLVSYLCSMSQS